METGVEKSNDSPWHSLLVVQLDGCHHAVASHAQLVPFSCMHHNNAISTTRGHLIWCLHSCTQQQHQHQNANNRHEQNICSGTTSIARRPRTEAGQQHQQDIWGQLCGMHQHQHETSNREQHIRCVRHNITCMRVNSETRTPARDQCRLYEARQQHVGWGNLLGREMKERVALTIL
jgi:hypothetical protein